MRKSVNNYLKAIYEASYTKTGTSNKQIATILDVLPGSVTEAINNLVDDGLVVRNNYHEIALTESGYQLVAERMYHYRLCEVWLAKIIILPLVRIPTQAWLMSEINDQELIAKLNHQLGEPKVSPFGGILHLPDFKQRFGNQPESLNRVPIGSRIKMTSYLENASTVKYFQHTGLQLQQVLTVTNCSKTIPVITLVDNQQQEYLINAAVARYLYGEVQSEAIATV